MIRCKRYVILRVEVLRGNLKSEREGKKFVDSRNDLTTTLNCE